MTDVSALQERLHQLETVQSRIRGVAGIKERLAAEERERAEQARLERLAVVEGEITRLEAELYAIAGEIESEQARRQRCLAEFGVEPKASARHLRGLRRRNRIVGEKLARWRAERADLAND